MPITRTEHGRPAWAPDVDHVRSMRNMTVRELAAELGISYTTVSGVISGSRRSPNIAKRICSHLSVEYIEGEAARAAAS